MNEQERIQNVFSALTPSQSTIQEVLKMKRVSEISQTLEITKTQIGLYISENLIHPAREAKKHFDSGVMTEPEVQQLQAVKCLRIHDFGLEEIRYLSVCGEASADYLRQKSEKKLVLYTNMEDVLSAVAALQANAPEGRELEKLRKELRRFPGLPRDPNEKPTFGEKYGAAIALTGILLILLVILFAKLEYPAAKVLAVLVLCAIGGLIALVSGIVYLVRRKPPKEYSHKTMAVIRKLDRVTEFDTTFAMGRSIVPGAGFREQGQGGIWQFVFMFWNEIRPDHYFPIVEFTHGGKERIATFRFGGFRHTWKAGDTISVFYSEDDDGIACPEHTGFMVKKSVLALCAAAILFGVFFPAIGPVTRAASSDFMVRDLHEILFGIEDNIYEGTEQISDSEIRLDFTHFSGSRHLPLNCRKGDCIYVETADSLDDLQLHLFVDMKTNMGRMIPDQYLWDEEHNGSKAVYPIAADGTYWLDISAYRAAGWVHAAVFPGKDAAVMAGDALNALADSRSLALKAFVGPNTETVESTTTLCVDNGRYYLKTEDVGGIQEVLFDGSAGWVRSGSGQWEPSAEVLPEPKLLSGLRADAAMLTRETEHFRGISYLEGRFFCYMTDDYLEGLGSASRTYTLGNVYAELEEASRAVSLFRLTFDFKEGQDGKTVSAVFTVRAAEDMDPFMEIERHLKEV